MFKLLGKVSFLVNVLKMCLYLLLVYQKVFLEKNLLVVCASIIIGHSLLRALLLSE